MVMKRIIPCLDVKDGRVVKGVSFAGLADCGDPVALAARYDAEGADELVFLDITAGIEGRETAVRMASEVARRLFIPFTVGGGIRTVADARALLRTGCDKVAVNSAAKGISSQRKLPTTAASSRPTTSSPPPDTPARRLMPSSAAGLRSHRRRPAPAPGRSPGCSPPRRR